MYLYGVTYSSVDCTCIAIAEVTEEKKIKLVRTESFQEFSVQELIDRIHVLNGKYPIHNMFSTVNGLGSVVIEELQHKGYSVWPINKTHSSGRIMAEELIKSYQDGDLIVRTMPIVSDILTARDNLNEIDRHTWSDQFKNLAVLIYGNKRNKTFVKFA